MDIAVLGTGTVGRTLAAGLADLGHAVAIGTRDPDATLARTEPDAFGNPPFPAWASEHPDVAVATLADAAADAELVVNATNGAATIEALEAAGEDNLAGKVLVDVANPLDFSAGFPPTLFVADTDSLAERVQRRFPDARVVKALNTVTASLMVDPGQLADAAHTGFVSGDDQDAKQVVIDLLAALGWTDVIDLGDITTARGAEMYLALWVRLMGVLETPAFSIKVVR